MNDPAGKVKISRKEIAKLIGKVFLQRAAVNLLSTVLDTPEYFWSAPDSMQSLYKRVCEYMELDERVEVLNNRFQVLFISLLLRLVYSDQLLRSISAWSFDVWLYLNQASTPFSKATLERPPATRARFTGAYFFQNSLYFPRQTGVCAS